MKVRLFSRIDRMSLAVVAFVALLGSPFLGVGLYEAYQTRKKTGTFIRTGGTVVDNQYTTTNHDGTVSGAYHPVVEFTDAAGAVVRFTEGVGSLPPDYAAGEQVTVVYNPQDPKDARVYTWKRVWFVPTLFVVIGLLPAVITIAVMGVVRRR